MKPCTTIMRIATIPGDLEAGIAVRFQQVVHSSETGEADCVQQSLSTGDVRMDIHKNARLTFVRREQLAERVILQESTLNSVAAEFSVCARIAATLVQRVEQLRRPALHRPAHRSDHRPESHHRQPHPSAACV